MSARKTFMTQAGNLRNHGESLTTALMTTGAVKQGGDPELWGPRWGRTLPIRPEPPERKPGRACFEARATLRGSNPALLWSAVGGKKEV
ncbi:MAG: hypothetical protein PVI80_13470 [Anaerolineae bacterium]